MTTTALLAPVTDLAATQLGERLYRKQVLKKGTISYQGRTLVFDDAYLNDLAQSFRDRAYDQVAFQLADADNTHTLDPERTRGEVVDLEVTPTGLDAILRLSDDGARLVDTNPNLGVSCRIEEAVVKADGRRYPRAVQHVLGTLNPRVTGMSPWQAVNLAADQPQAVDLTAAVYQEGAGPVPADEFTDEERARLRQLLDTNPAAPAATTPTTAAAEAPVPAVTDPSDEDLEAEIQRILAEETEEAATSSLSQVERDAIDLANRTAEIASQRIAALEAERDRANWQTERSTLLAAGVPLAVVDLAQAVIAPTTIDLADGATAPAAADVVRRILAEFPRIDLSGELGRRVPGSTPDGEKAADDLAKQFLAKHDFNFVPGGTSR